MAAPNPKPRLSQQDEERHYFELFRKTYTLPAGEVEYGDKPDVIITGPRTIGIEITNFYHEDGSTIGSEQRQASRRTSVAALGQEIYRKNGSKNIEVKLNFDKAHPIEDAEEMARKVAEFVASIEDRKTGTVPRHLHGHIPELDSLYVITRLLQYRDDYFDPEFPNGQPDPEAGFTTFERYWNRREAQAIREANYTPLTWEGKWQVMQAHSFGLMAADRLTEILRDKESKAKKYRPCDANWLLVIVDWRNTAQEQEIQIEGLSINSDAFERVIIYKPHFEHVVDVLTTKPGRKEQ